MNLTVQSIEIREPHKLLQVRYQKMAELAEGGEVSLGAHREVFAPGDDVTGAAPEVQQQAALLWTPEVIATFEAARAAQ